MSFPLGSAIKLIFAIFVFTNLAATGLAEEEAVSAGKTPPFIDYGTPGYFFQDVTDLTSVSVHFTVPVTGVEAGDLTVNGSPASKVTGKDAGPYVFTGYRPATLGKVHIVVAPGKIKRFSNQVKFDGRSWSVRLFDPARDDDGDSIINSVEIEKHSDPAKADTDDDGLPDTYELAHPCLVVFRNEALPHNEYGRLIPGNSDTDHDGMTNLEEFKRGIDPCFKEAE